MKNEFQKEVVSVIIPTYNSETYIERTLKSVLLQTYKSIEIIIVDDCSTDNTIRQVEKILSENTITHNIKVISLKNNVGAAEARNIALKEAKGQFVAFLDADDIWEKTKLENQTEFMKTNKYAFTFTSYYRKDENDNLINLIKVPEKINYSSLLKNTIIGCSTVVIDRNLSGDFTMPLLRKGQDTATWLQLLKKIDFAYGINTPLTFYTIRKNSVSYNKFGALKRTWHLYRNVEKLPFLKAAYNYFFYAINALLKRKKNLVRR